MSNSAEHRFEVDAMIATVPSSSGQSEIESLWSEWIDRKAKRKVDRSYLAILRSTMRGFLRVSKAREFNDLRPRHLPDFIRAQAKRREYSRKYLTAQAKFVRSFVTWASEERGFSDPFATFDIRRLPDLGRREKAVNRRMLLLDEWDFLRHHMVAENVTRKKLTTEMRILLYTVALQTGYRAVECSRLRISDLHDECERPYLELSGAGGQRTKNRQPARQYIKPDLAACLRQMVRDRWSGVVPWLRRTDAKLFPAGIRTWQNIAGVLRQDLAAARVAYREKVRQEGQPFDPDYLNAVDSQGRVIDFHALRYTCGAWLVHLGADIKTVQRVMRHGTSKLTLDLYGSMYPGNDWEAVQKMPSTL